MNLLKTSRKLLVAPMLTAVLLCSAAAKSSAGVFVSITVAPPALPVYVQPPCPVDGYLWTPGYWAYGVEGYYWVPGVWVHPPRIGVLWTPGYWGFARGVYGWRAGYWGPHVGFYGGVNYGFGYVGTGFFGGGWSGGAYRYNTAYSNVNTTVIRNVYVDRTVINNTTVINNRASFNGPGGITARPSPEEQAVAHEQHFQPTQNQMVHEQTASQDRSQLASFNHGRPTAPAVGTVNPRRFDQQQRIAQGVRSGQMTPGEVARTERREQNINRQVASDRRVNGGGLSPQERRQINREQNRAGRQIQEENHNERVAPR